MSKNQLKTLIKCVISCCLILGFFYFGHLDLSGISEHLARAHWAWFIGAAALHVVGLLLSSTRWKLLLMAQGINVSIFKLFQSYLVGGFFNVFLPGRVGGDVVRVYDTAQIKKSGIEPLAVVLIERASGMLTLLTLAALVMLLNLDIGFDPADYTHRFWWSFGFISLVVAGVLILLNRTTAGFLLRIFEFGILKRLHSKAVRMYEAVVLYRRKPYHLLAALGVGLALQFNYIIHYYFVARALGFDSVKVAFFFFAIPIRAVLLMAPFFINGIGLRESIDMFFFDKVGITGNAAVSFSWLSFFLILCYGLIGGLIYMLRGRRT